ncbi:ArsB/NhaD family transporter [Microbacterium horticulturae]|uniref:ArsB/NhaD family transporter n=1 Tax=Microbacterium horticulturae TaxID=3028316 RepID=A0ABY8BUF1_9MICO|nr:SLC13 family permease [Microbacterium sp. KACC 23027]WEG07452.1 ArsB/NhaD family transporter [Microbacterium sp. KACC 23027]
MKTVAVGGVLLVLGTVALATGILPLSDALVLWDRVWPVLLFVIAITVVTELAAVAGVFTVVARHVARWGRGRAWMLWMLVVAAATVCTVFLSLDTTAVLLTPIVIALARQSGLNPLPFALTTVWTANAGSLLLPVSNLTNLLAQRAMGDPTPGEFAALLWPAALAALAMPLLVILLVSGRHLRARYQVPETAAIEDPVLYRWSAGTLVVLFPLLVSGVPVWMPAVVAALVLMVVFAVRQRRSLRFGLLPWRLLVFVSGLFLAVDAVHALGLGDALAALVGGGTGAGDLLRMASVGAASANLVNNLPAYLALEPAAGMDPVRLAALLVGVNAGPLILPWGSLATLLWHDRLVAMGVHVPWKRVIAWGAIAAPLSVVAGALALVAGA